MSEDAGQRLSLDDAIERLRHHSDTFDILPVQVKLLQGDSTVKINPGEVYTANRVMKVMSGIYIRLLVDNGNRDILWWIPLRNCTPLETKKSFFD